MAIKVIVEVEDGDVTGVQSNSEMDVMVLNRDRADPTSSDYIEDAFGAPARQTTFHVEASTDVADLYDQLIIQDPVDCACDTADDD